MRGPRALEMLKASREGSCPQGVPRQPLTHKRAPEVGTSGLLPASAPSGLWHPSRAILPRRTMETERRHATGAACAPFGRGRVPCSRSSAGPVHLCKTQSCRAWPCSVRLPASLGAVCGCVDGCPELPRRRARSSRGAPRSAAHPQRTSAPAPRPSAPAFLRAATSHTYARGLPIRSTRFPISTTRTRLALRTRSTAHELPGQRFEQSQAKAAREQQERVLSKVTQRSAARGEHPRPALFSVSSCGLSVTSAGPAAPARASAHARTHAPWLLPARRACACARPAPRPAWPPAARAPRCRGRPRAPWVCACLLRAEGARRGSRAPRPCAQMPPQAPQTSWRLSGS